MHSFGLQAHTHTHKHTHTHTHVILPSQVSVHKQGLHFVRNDHPVLHGTLSTFSTFTLAASPDALLQGVGCKVLLEIKCACLYISWDDGSWVCHPTRLSERLVRKKKASKFSILFSARFRCWLLRFPVVCWQDGMQVGAQLYDCICAI